MNQPANQKKRLATCSLAGCFGCHMSLLDIDDRLLDLVELVEFSKSPLTDIKSFNKRCHIGLVEGGCANTANVEELFHFRENCNILVAVGACALNGGLPALRNEIDLTECLEEAYLEGVTTDNPDGIIPDDLELPALLNRVTPLHEVVRIDYFLPGCPPAAEVLWQAINGLLSDGRVELPRELIRYD